MDSFSTIRADGRAVRRKALIDFFREKRGDSAAAPPAQAKKRGRATAPL
jgi:hypothetical protein